MRQVESPDERLARFKQRMRASWASGDYTSVAERDLWMLGSLVVERLGVRPDEDVLDVACGTGNGALRAALVGARVVGVDLTPELFQTGQRLAADAGVAIEWREGDAESLPCDEASFDAVMSINGVMFAPRHRVAAHELARVLRTGGRMLLCNRTADSAQSQILRVIGRYLPPPPEATEPPWLWGSADHVRSLFRETDVELEFSRETIQSPPFETPDAAIEFYTTRLGPFMAARAQAEADGRWQALHAELASLLGRATATEYLIVTGWKRR